MLEKDDIHNVEACVPIVACWTRDSWERIKTALAELGTTNNSASPKLPSFDDLWRIAIKQLDGDTQCEGAKRGARSIYRVICRQLSGE